MKIFKTIVGFCYRIVIDVIFAIMIGINTVYMHDRLWIAGLFVVRDAIIFVLFYAFLYYCVNLSAKERKLIDGVALKRILCLTTKRSVFPIVMGSVFALFLFYQHR